MNNTLTNAKFEFKGQIKFYRGKVRDVYYLKNDYIVMVVSDRISAFDNVMPRGIPYKGQILNQISIEMINQTSEYVPNWFINSPDPNVSIGHLCDPFKVEMVIRGYLAGHAFREYKKGKRLICGVKLPDGLKENDMLPDPIITPATKAEAGKHDEDISREDIIKNRIVSDDDYMILEKYTRKLFSIGQKIANERGLILVDTKYEFGKTKSGEIVLIDEIHTPDSSRYFYKDGYEERQNQCLPQKQLSKEFLRQWLISNDFQGLDGQIIPQMDYKYIETVSERYIELYEKIIGKNFKKLEINDIQKRISVNTDEYLKSYLL